MRTIIHFMGMKSTKYGGLEKFMTALVRHNESLRFILVYEEYPVSSEYINALNSLNVVIEVVAFNSMGFPKQLQTYRNLFKRYNPDIVHFHFSNNHIGAFAARSYGIRQVYKTVHSCLTSGYKEIETYRQLGLGQQIRFAGGLANKMYTKILFVSDYTYRQYEKVFGPSALYQRIYLGVEQPEIERVLKPDDVGEIPDGFHVVTTIAFAHPLKGVDVLIKAIPQINDTIFISIGLDDCEYTEGLKSLAAQIGVNDRIRWIGIKDNVLPYLSITDIYVQPSRTEALSLAACEALSLGIPVVGSNVGGLPEVASILCPRENSDALSDIINQLITDPNYLNVLSSSAKDKFQRCFNLNLSVCNYSEVYKCPTN